MWSTDFDDYPGESKRKRRKVEKTNPPSSVFKVLEPKKTDDLVTHSKKIAEVRFWLEQVERSPGILLLTGPAGSAKTTTLKVVASSLDIDIEEWVNPTDKLGYEKSEDLIQNSYDSAAYVEPKQIDKFQDFVFRSSRYKNLFSCSRRRILLIEDFPNHFIWQPSTFFDFLAKYSSIGRCPIVFICTDDEKLNLSVNLFPNNVRDSLGIVNIKFNSISQTGLLKILQRCAKFLSKEKLSDIAKASNGDIRTALSSLQFLLAGSNVLSKQASDAVAKDVSTEFYQTLGRVLYPKRKEPNSDGAIFLYDVNEIAQHCNQIFLSMLQENFLNTFTSLKDITEACAILSDADLFAGEQDLDKYTALTCVIGLMAANKQPKKGSFQPMGRSRWSSRKGDHNDPRPYPHFQETRRTLNLDIIPFVKHLPNFAVKISQIDAYRFRIGNSLEDATPIFKMPLPPQPMETNDEEMIIEEFDD